MKIAVIGGAGVRTVIFINGLLKRYKKLHIDEVVLYDIQEEKQRIIEKLCKHVVERNHEELKVWAVSDPVEAITGADYIVTTLRVGGDHSRVVDETIALDLGVIGQETTGVGGFSMAVRTIPVLIEYCELTSPTPPVWSLRHCGAPDTIRLSESVMHRAAPSSVWPVIWVWKKTICMWNFSA